MLRSQVSTLWGVKWDPEEEIGRNLKRGLAGVLTDCF